MAKMASVVRDKTKKPMAASAVSAVTSRLPGITGGAMGPAGFDASRDAWANALSTMSGVNTPTPLTALAKVAGMGLAGYGQGKATREKEAGSSAFKSKLADALAGTPDNGALMGLMADPYADESSQRMLWSMYERNNPSEQDQLALRKSQLEIEQMQQPDPVTGVEVGGRLINPQTGEVMYEGGPEQQKPVVVGGRLVNPVTGDIIFESPQDDATKGVEVNGKLVNPLTGEVIYDGPGSAADAPKVDTYKATDPQTGKPVEITREWRNGDWVEVGRAPVQQSGINIDMGGGGDKQVFDRMGQMYDGVNTMRQGLRSLREAKKAILDGAITGPMAEQRLYLQKIGAALGIADPSRIENTETFRAAIAPQVAAMIKATVGSTQISNTDRDFAMMAAGGQIDLNEGTILRLVDIMERANAAAIDDYQARLDRVYAPDSADPNVQRSRAIFEIQDEPAMPGDIMRLPQDDAGADAMYEQLPSGAWFQAPDGSIRRKP
jgi:hypothetical protein